MCLIIYKAALYIYWQIDICSCISMLSINIFKSK